MARHENASETEEQLTVSNLTMPNGEAEQPKHYSDEASTPTEAGRRRTARPSKQRRWRWLIIAFCAALGVLGGGIWSYLTPPSYIANAIAFFTLAPRHTDDQIIQDPFGGGQFVLQRLDTYAELATSVDVLRGVTQDLHRGNVSELRRHVQATATPGTALLRISVTDSDRQTAVQIADSVMANLGRTVATVEAGGVQDVAPPVPSVPGVGQALAPPGNAPPGEQTAIPPVQLVPVQPAIVPRGASGLGHWAKPLIGLLAGLVVGYVLSHLVRPRRNDDGDQNALTSSEHRHRANVNPESLQTRSAEPELSEPRNFAGKAQG
jgi:hypothetical protein